MSVAMEARSLVIEDETRRSIHDHPSTLQDDQYTVADTASTSFSVQSNYTTGTVGSYLPLSRLSKHSFKLRTTSSFPSILGLYKQPIKEEDSPDQGLLVKKKSRRYDRRRNLKGGKTTDWEAAIEGRNKHEQRAIRIEAIARDQMEKYEKYIVNLKAKVEQQREARRKQYEELEERLRQKEEEKKQKHALKRPKREYIHDRKYLKKLPETKFCKLVRLSDDLAKKGVLKNRSDIESFWQDFGKHGIDKTDIFNRDTVAEVHLSNMNIGKKTALAPIDYATRSQHEGKKKKKKGKPPSDIAPSEIPSIEIEE